MFLSCDGIQILASFLSLYYEENQDLIMLSIDSFTVFWKNLLLPVEDLTLLLVEHDVPRKIVNVMKKLAVEASTNIGAEKFLDKTFFLLSCFANGPHSVQEILCESEVMKSIFDLVEVTNIVHPRIVKILHEIA